MRILSVFLLVTFLFSCSRETNPTNISQTEHKQIDSLLNFGSIKAIYSSADKPPLITYDALEEGESQPPLYSDSIHRWTHSKFIIDSIRQMFPILTKKHEGLVEYTCCGHRELLMESTHKLVRFSWNINTSDSAVFMDTLLYSGDKNKLNKIYQLLDRKIITKEIFFKDTIKFAFQDHYNRTYSWAGYKTKFIYIFK